jgi:Histidine kinase-, DNA gyrase B-, and HSP90-like ATPase
MSAANKGEIKSVPSSPEKSFFISMLTRDIELQDSVLDLLDNCVDGAIRTRSREQAESDSFSGFWAHITFSDERFTIEDNCGGIPWTIAHEYAFRMGRPEGADSAPGTIGVVGIGMKRAIFKMGRECHVYSAHKDDAFVVHIPPSWFERSQWSDFEAHSTRRARSHFGTRIEITRLTEDAKKDFAEGSTFRANFEGNVADAYSILIEKGFVVRVNGNNVAPRPVKLYFEDPRKPKLSGELIRPYMFECKKGRVRAIVAVGYRSPMKTQQEQENETTASFAAKEAGWTVVCNNRVVLSNDRTVHTGWGFGGVPNFHNQFSCIAGFVDFQAPDTGDLPVTTTKRGIDAGKEIYTLVRQRMQEGLKLFTRNTNRWKGFEGELKARFERIPVLDLIELERMWPKLSSSVVRGNGLQRQFTPKLPERTSVITTRRITFVREMSDIEQVSRCLFDEVREPNEVGEECFDRSLRDCKKRVRSALKK